RVFFEVPPMNDMNLLALLQDHGRDAIAKAFDCQLLLAMRFELPRLRFTPRMARMRIEFTDGVIGIRPYFAEDAAPLFEAVRESVRELSVWMPWCHENYSVEESQSFASTRAAEWEKAEHFSFVIYDCRDAAFLGGVGLNFPNRVHAFANLGYWVRSSRTRLGVATAAVRLAARFGLEDLGFKRVEIVAAVGNLASQRVAEKAGARREGVLRKRLLLHGQSHDAVMFSLVAEDLGA
ncbi:MAG TPA: GNAT family protein, partial [Verrucomicrobiae bacterium]|nr:GNAT family protein [Verrucomicrobiae bacterium]